MRGKVKYAKFPAGLYHAIIDDVKEGIDSKQEDIIIVHYRILEGERKDQTFKERLKSASSAFLSSIGEPCEYNAEWDTNNWIGKTVWIDVKYSDDEAQWPRYGHYQTPPKAKDVSPTKYKPKTSDDDSGIPF